MAGVSHGRMAAELPPDFKLMHYQRGGSFEVIEGSKVEWRYEDRQGDRRAPQEGLSVWPLRPSPPPGRPA